MTIKIMSLLLVSGLCYAAEREESPMRPERPVPQKAKENIKEKHKEVKKQFKVPAAPKIVYRRLEL